VKKVPKPKQVYQLKITLKNSHPPIWRRVLVPEHFTLGDLHDIIQTVMPWDDAHLHEFVVGGVTYGMPDMDSFFEDDTRDEDEVSLQKVIKPATKRFKYLYDFGDSWEHVIEIEKKLPAEEGVYYPVCLKGAKAAPPDDVGGLWGYYNLLEVQSKPDSPEYDNVMEWLGEPVDPDAFDLEVVNRRLKFPDLPGRIVAWTLISPPKKSKS